MQTRKKAARWRERARVLHTQPSEEQQGKHWYHAFGDILAILRHHSVAILFFLPWLDRSPVKSIRYKGLWYKLMLGLFVIAFIRLGMLGMSEGTPAQTIEMRVWTLVYFAFFILLFFLEEDKLTIKNIGKYLLFGEP